MSLQILRAALSAFGSDVTSRFATGKGEPEDHLRGPFEILIKTLGPAASANGVVPSGEHHLVDNQVRPD